MSLANYTGLQSSIADWLHKASNSAFISVIPDIITLAEKRINGDLDARLQDTVSTLATVAGTQTVASPTDVVNIRSLTLQSSPNVVLDYLTPDQFNTQYAAGTSEQPRAFTIIGTNIYLGPIPDAVYSIQCIYKALVPALSSGSPTNWLLTNYPQVYLAACLVTAARWLRRPKDEIADYEALYVEGIDSVNSVDWYSGSTMRVRSDVRL
jgi:hypothetical protein